MRHDQIVLKNALETFDVHIQNWPIIDTPLGIISLALRIYQSSYPFVRWLSREFCLVNLVLLKSQCAGNPHLSLDFVNAGTVVSYRVASIFCIMFIYLILQMIKYFALEFGFVGPHLMTSMNMFLYTSLQSIRFSDCIAFYDSSSKGYFPGFPKRSDQDTLLIALDSSSFSNFTACMAIGLHCVLVMPYRLRA